MVDEYTCNGHTFHPGDEVYIRDWDDMAEQYGLFSNGRGIKCDVASFVDNMRIYCGARVTIKSIRNDGRVFFDGRLVGGWAYTCDMIEPVRTHQEKYEFSEEFLEEINSLLGI